MEHTVQSPDAILYLPADRVSELERLREGVEGNFNDVAVELSLDKEPSLYVTNQGRLHTGEPTLRSLYGGSVREETAHDLNGNGHGRSRGPK